MNQLKGSIWNHWERSEVGRGGYVYVCGGKRGSGGRGRSVSWSMWHREESRKYRNMTSPPVTFCSNSCWRLLYKQLLTMFGRKCIQQKSQLTLFDICNLTGFGQNCCQTWADCFVQAPFPPIWTCFFLALYKIKNNTLQCFDLCIHWKLNPGLLMQVSLCVDFHRCSIKGLCLPVSMSMSAHVRVCTLYAFNVRTCLLISH